MTVGKKYLKRNVLGTIPFFEDLSNGAELTESCKSRERIVQPAVCKRWSANDVNRLNVLHAAECRHCPCYEGAIPQYITNKYRPHSSLAVVPTEDGYGDYLNWIAHADATLTFPQTVVLRYTLQEPGRADNAAIDYGKWFIARLRRLDNNLADGRFVYRRTVPPHCTTHCSKQSNLEGCWIRSLVSRGGAVCQSLCGVTCVTYQHASQEETSSGITNTASAALAMY